MRVRGKGLGDDVARGVKRDDTVRAAVIAALVSGMAPAEAARQWKLPESTVRSFLSSKDFKEARARKSEDFGMLIADMLRENFITLTAQAQHLRDKDYLTRQPVEGIAIAYGVLADKTIRILEAAERGQATEEETS